MWTRQGALDEAARTANALREVGVAQGDRVALLLENGPDFLRVLWGTAVLGAVAVPVNPAFHGAALSHVLALSRPRCVVSDPRFHGRFDAIGLSETAVFDPTDVRGADRRLPELSGSIDDSDVALLVLTSGTTGPSKLSCTTYRQCLVGGSVLISDERVTSDDTMLFDMPMFHLAMGYHISACLATGTRMAVRTAPELDRYWEVARDCGANLNVLLGSTMSYLLTRPISRADREHGIRSTMVVPVPRTARAYQKRFCVPDVTTAYGSTELPLPLALTSNDDIMSSIAGRLRAGFQAMIVDSHGAEVPDGTVGELLIRGEAPGMVSPGYLTIPRPPRRLAQDR